MNSTLYVLALLLYLIHSALTIEPNPDGKWVYGMGVLRSIDMKTGEHTIIDQLIGYNITEVSKIDEHRILVEANRPYVYSSEDQLGDTIHVFMYDMQRKNFTYLLNGSDPAYSPKLNKIAFRSNGIKIADIDGAPESIETLLPNGAYSQGWWTLFDDESILFEPPDFNQKRQTKARNTPAARVLNIHDKAIEDANAFDNCYPSRAVWISRKKQFLCRDSSRIKNQPNPYFLTDLDGSNRQSLPAKFNDSIVIGYAEPIDSFIYADCRDRILDFAKTCWLYAGNFEDYSTKRIAKGGVLLSDHRAYHFFNGAYFK